MSNHQGDITHVSDTALMVAACRALETQSPDGFVRDPYAERLAGERGMAIMNNHPSPEMLRFGVGLRSRLLDELLLEALSTHPIQTVLCVGCGLDARPWRLDLSPDLRWIEVDFADMLDYKEAVMSSEKPRCRRERLVADVTDSAQRQLIYAAAGREPALMITEGLLMYLPGSTIDALAAEVGEQSGIAHWISDVMTSGFAKAIRMDTAQSIRNVQAPDCLEGEEILETVRRHGWTTASWRSYIKDTAFARERSQRMMGGAQPPAPPPEALSDPTGIHRFARM